MSRKEKERLYGRLLLRAKARRSIDPLIAVRGHQNDPLWLIERIIGPEQWVDPCWDAWRSFLKAFFALPMNDQEIDIYQQCTGRLDIPARKFKDATLIVGRRGGKSRVTAALAVYFATSIDWRPYLAPGEIGYIPVIAPDRKQAKAIMGYCTAPFLNDPLLTPFLAKPPTTEQIELVDNVIIEVMTCSYRTIRSRTVLMGLADELGFWPAEDSATPDTEVMAALTPCMATIPGAGMLKASSPYARRGVLWDDYQEYYGKAEAPTLVWQADTRTMNPMIAQEFIDEELAKDYEKNSAEYLAQFRRDIAAFVTKEAVDAVVQPGRIELLPERGVQYTAFCDPSGGSADSMTLAIGHTAGNGQGVLDMVREVVPPFNPKSVVAEFSQDLRRFGLASLEGDAYAGEWPRAEFREHGIGYEVAELHKSQIYTEFLPLLNSGQVEFLDSKRLIAQTLSLERRTARGGRDSIDHPPGSHDDVINAAAGLLIKVSRGGSELEQLRRIVG